MKSNNARLSPLSCALLLLVWLIPAACSTTSRLAPDEELYNGMKPLSITVPEGEKAPEGLEEEIATAVAATPNNVWPFTTIRNPFPIGLWIWNHWSGHRGGIKKWAYDKFAAEPVLISEVRPDLRTALIEQILDNNGYFQGRASYELIAHRNPRKKSVKYSIITGPAYKLDFVQLPEDTCLLNHLIDSVASRQKALAYGQQFNRDSLAAVRTRIVNVVRNRGFYYFAPEYLEFLADTIQWPGHVALRLNIANNTPTAALTRYEVGNVTMVVHRNSGGGSPDTIPCQRATLIQFRPSRLRSSIVDDCVAFRRGRPMSQRAVNNTQTRLARLGIFNNIDINVAPPDSLSQRLNVLINCTMDMPIEARIEANGSLKSNSYAGPGAMIGMAHRNLFGGGEQLDLTLTGSYEWQTGSNSSSLLNSYETSIQSSLSFPRLLAPSFIPRLRRDQAWTRFTLNADLLNRPHYFRMAQFNSSMGYDWHPSRYTSTSFTPLKFTYTNLLNTTANFDSITHNNRALAESFRSQFIPQISYTFAYDRAFNRSQLLNWTITAQEAGALFCSAWRLAGVTGEKRLFNIPISQFAKLSGQIVYNHRATHGEDWLVFRLASGIAHAYGNSQQVPYAEQFWIGGANSVRAFTVRSLGPGSYRPAPDHRGNYFDQTGTFKFEANFEFRFPLISLLHGALFLDAGNVWLLKKDPLRPGGELQAKTFLRDLALGTGAGLRIDLDMLVLRADLGIGIHAPYHTSRHTYYNMPNFRQSLAFHLAIGYPF